mmetsp:Transcript_19578/g.47251  ORF Transcript_19578/g.47251 Transcript_19578/m.47251 type:complete len:616 (+) Transcript_19578:344-2191(+)
MPGVGIKSLRNHIPSNLGGKRKKNKKQNKHIDKEPTNLQSIKAKLSQNSLTELKLGFEEVDFYSKRDVQSLIKVIKEQFWQRVIVDKASPLQSIKIGWRLPNFAIGPVLQQVIPLLLQDPIRVTSVQLILNAWVPDECLKRIISWHALTELDLRSVKVRCPLQEQQQQQQQQGQCRNHRNSTNRHHQHHHRHHKAGVVADGYIDASTFAWLSDDTTASASSMIVPSGGTALGKSSSSSCATGPTTAMANMCASLPLALPTSPISSNHSPSGNNNNNNNSGSGLWTEERNITSLVPYMSANIERLKLMDCGIDERHIPDLCYHVRRRRCLQFLSLRQNRKLNGGFSDLFELPYVHVLDLSLCDLDAHDGYEIKRTLCQTKTACSGSSSNSSGSGKKMEEKEPTTSNRAEQHQQHRRETQLRKLCLAGNYRLSDAIPGLVDVSSERLVELDCSHCDVQGKLQTKVFQVLAEAPGCTLQCFRMSGTRIGNIKELLHCIKTNTSLRRLVLDHPREPFPISNPDMELIADALEWNYHLQELKVDTFGRVPERVQKKMDFWLTLNQCGRGAILNESTEIVPLSISLSEAANKDDRNILFWLLKHGSASFCASHEAKKVAAQ